MSITVKETLHEVYDHITKLFQVKFVPPLKDQGVNAAAIISISGSIIVCIDYPKGAENHCTYSSVARDIFEYNNMSTLKVDIRPSNYGNGVLVKMSVTRYVIVDGKRVNIYIDENNKITVLIGDQRHQFNDSCGYAVTNISGIVMNLLPDKEKKVKDIFEAFDSKVKRDNMLFTSYINDFERYIGELVSK